MHKVEFNGEILFAQDGQLLSEVLMKNKKYTEHLCGGKGVCKKCTVTVNGREELSCRYAVNSDVVVKSNANSGICSFTGVQDSGVVSENMCYCLDIGTTTLALSLVSLDERKTVKTVTATNPQRVYGADVLTRVDYCRKNGIKELNSVLIQSVNSMIKEIGSYSVKTMFAAGNTTMLHTFFGEDCSSIGEFPYTPVFLNSREVSGESIGVTNTERVVSLPSIHSFVGADIVAGLNFAEFPEEGKFNLLVDLGTNAEIVLFSKDSVLCTSAAAGPCFEGGNISCGMSAVKGAVFSYKKGSIKTIGNAVPSGVCATGLIDLVATLLDDGIIDETGYMEEDFEVSYNVVLTQQDVRQYQLAKSAVCSGIYALTDQAGIGFENIEKVYVSGGFSHELNVSNAVKTGLLPKEVLQKCVPVNNSCLQGIVKFALENNDLSCILKNGVYADLAQNNNFSRLFVENMMFKLT